MTCECGHNESEHYGKDLDPEKFDTECFHYYAESDTVCECEGYGET